MMLSASALQRCFLSLCFLGGLQANRCGGRLQGECTCTPLQSSETEITEINCTGAIFQTADVFSSIGDYFTRVDTIIMTDNKFPELPKDLFGTDVKNPRLSSLDLSRNEIRKIHALTFRGMPRLEVLQLSHNNIAFLDNEARMFGNLPRLKELRLTDAFESTSNMSLQLRYLQEMFQTDILDELSRLYLDSNSIYRLPANLFCALPQLEHLTLRNNSLTNFRIGLDCIIPLVELDLSSNAIRYLGQSFTTLIDEAEHLHRVNLSDNPFHCDCHLVPFIRWLETSDRVVDKEQLHCVTALPQRFAGLKLLDLTLDSEASLQCADDGSSHIHGVYVVIALCIILLSAVLCTVCVKQRNSWLQRVRRVTQMHGYSKLMKEHNEPEFV